MRAAAVRLLLILALGASLVQAQPTFQNLGFEAANIPPNPDTNHVPYEIPFAMALPGWTGYYGTNVAQLAGVNVITMGLYNISTIGLDWPYSWIYGGVIEGSYSVLLQSGSLPPDSGLPAAIAQTGLVPSTSRSLQMKVYRDELGDGFFDPTGWAVTLGDERISLTKLELGPNYALYGGDITSHAGFTEELRIAALIRPTREDYGFILDSIEFSPTPVPEPATAGLTLAALILLVARNGGPIILPAPSRIRSP